MQKLLVGAAIIAASGAGAIYYMGKGNRSIEQVALITAAFTGACYIIAKQSKVI